MSEQIINRPSEVHHRPMGPLEEGDQAVMDAVDATPQSNFHSPASERLIDDIITKPSTSLTHHVDGGMHFVDTSQSNLRGRFLSRKKPTQLAMVKVNPAGIHAEVRDTPDSSFERVMDDLTFTEATLDSQVRSGKVGGEHDPKRVDRQENQAIKKEAARRINAARQHLGKLGVNGLPPR